MCLYWLLIWWSRNQSFLIVLSSPHVHASFEGLRQYYVLSHGNIIISVIISTVYFVACFVSIVTKLLSYVQLFATPWTAACKTSLFFTFPKSLLKLMSTESVMLSNHLILCPSLPLLPSIFPSIRVFSNESALHIRWQNTGASASASVLPMNMQGWFPLGLTSLISLQSEGLSRVFSSSTVQKNKFFGTQPVLLSNSHICDDYWKKYSFDYLDLCWQSDVFAF